MTERFFGLGGKRSRAPEAQADLPLSEVGAGSMTPTRGDEAWLEERLSAMSFDVHIVAEGYQYAVTVDSFLTDEEGGAPTFAGRHAFFMPRTSELDSRFGKGGTVRFLSHDGLAKVSGVTVNAERFYKAGELAEWRFRLVNPATQETYVGTVSAEDHWQGSHSHNYHTELYSLVSGTMTLVTEDPEYPGRITVLSITTKDGNNFEQTHFVYNTETRAVEGDVFVASAWGTPFLQTELQKAHNVYLSKGAVIGTAKKEDAPVPAGASAWTPEPSFDARLNDTAHGTPAHADIRAIINSISR